jgi:hypothetical protein
LLVAGGSAPDRARGLELLRTGCTGGDSWACDTLKQIGEK